MKQLPPDVADDVARLGGIEPSPGFRHFLTAAVRAARHGSSVAPRKTARQKDAAKPLDDLLRGLKELLPEGRAEVAGAFLAAVIAPDDIEGWIEKVARAKFNATNRTLNRAVLFDATDDRSRLI